MSASYGLLPFRFGRKPLARPLAESGRFEPVHVVDGDAIVSFRDLALRPVPRRPGACRFDKSGIVGVGDFVFVEIEGVQINKVGGSVVSLRSRLGV